MRLMPFTFLIFAMTLEGQIAAAQDPTYPVVDTTQKHCFDPVGDTIDCPVQGAALYGQDAQYVSLAAICTDNLARCVR